MPDPGTIAIVSVIVTGTTAVGVPIVNAVAAAHGDARRYRHERQSKDLDELRSLIDEIAMEVRGYVTATITLDKDRLGLFEYDRAVRVFELQPHLDEIGLVAGRCHDLNRRLVIRIGRDHATVQALGTALKKLDDAPTDLFSWKGEAECQESTQGKLAAAYPRWSSWHSAYEAFLDAACDLVGSPVRDA